MPKSKQSPALFELYAKGRTGGDPYDELDCDVGVAERVGGFRATVASVAKTIRSVAGPEAKAGADLGEGPRAIAVEGGRIHLALTSRAAGMVAFGLLAAGCLVFAAGSWVGHQSGVADGRVEAQRQLERAAVDEIDRARRTQPVEDLFANIGASPVSASDAEKPASRIAGRPQVTLTATREPAGAATPWVKGNTYVVVQCFRGDARDDAVKARDYLASQGVASAIFGSEERGFRLIASQGFNFSDDTQRKMADRFIQKIRTIGAAYFKSGGRYELKGFFATLTTDSW